MVSTVHHDPFSLFGFALRESDWALADLLASRLTGTDAARRRLQEELDEARANGAGQPDSLPELRWLAELTHNLDLEDDPV